jgi:hypothetical protein
LKFLISGDSSAVSTTSGCVPILALAAALDEVAALVLVLGFDVPDVVDELLVQAATASTANVPTAKAALRGILVGCIVHSVMLGRCGVGPWCM